MTAPDPGFGIYVHWPFCAAKCPYCDFNSHVWREIDHEEWKNALLADLKAQLNGLCENVITSVFFGGGTPSLMEPRTVEAILDEAANHLDFAEDVEITLEANPTSIEAGRFRDFRAAGINRASVGVQALNDADLQRLGRMHSADEAKTALDIANSTFDRTSFDLIYARQNQSLTDWERELAQALSLAKGHLSLYQLSVEPNTRFFELLRNGKLRGLPDSELSVDLYQSTTEYCAARGYFSYEVSNFAIAGEESRHNLIYWRGGRYLGVGPGAHGRIQRNGARFATQHISEPSAYLNSLENSNPTPSESRLSSWDQGVEYLMMSLRLSEGAELARIQSYPVEIIDKNAILGLIDQGLVERSNRILRATDSGRLVLNTVLAELIADHPDNN